MVTWRRAWRGAGAWFGWTLIWGIIGWILIIVGSLVLGRSFSNLSYFNNSVLGGYSATGNFAVGLVSIIIGSIIGALGAVASFFKINSEIITEEVKSQKPICSTCGRPLRFISEYQRWYCDNEKKYE